MLVQANQGHPDRLINAKAYSGARVKTTVLVWFQPLVPAAFYFKGAPPPQWMIFQCLSQGVLTHYDISDTLRYLCTRAHKYGQLE